MAAAGEWKLVQRRKPSPIKTTTTKTELARPYIPYYKQKTHAQAVSSTFANSDTGSQSEASTTSIPASRPNSPPLNSSAPRFFTSPHSPTALRFPPSTAFQEWHGRCFRCLKVGHSASTCCNPLKCGRCWADGHAITKCGTSNLNPAAEPFYPNAKKSTGFKSSAPTWVNKAGQTSKLTPPLPYQSTQQPKKPTIKPTSEPSFHDLLKEPPHPMPENRPDTMMCFIERDEDFFKEVQKLKSTVIFHGSDEFSLNPSQAVEVAVNTGLVRAEELRTASLANKRTLIHLPRGLKVQTFIRALPSSLWDKGISIQPWSQTDGTEIVMPRFKLLLDLIDFPLHIWREKHVIRAVAGIGVYLGSVPSDQADDCSYWRVVVATNDLGRVPKSLTVVVGGIKHKVRVNPVTWQPGPIYSQSDFPPPLMRYSKPLPTPPVATIHQHPRDVYRNRGNIDRNRGNAPIQQGEMIHCSRQALMEICQGIDTARLLPEFQQLVAGLASHEHVPTQDIRESMCIDQTMRPEDEAGQNLPKMGTITHTATNGSQKKLTTPIPTTLFQGDHSQHKDNHGQQESDPMTVESATEPDELTIHQFLETRKDKDLISGTESQKEETNHVASHSFQFKAQGKLNRQEVSNRRPQKIPDKQKEGGTGRIVPKSTSSHMRFRECVEKGKVRPRLEELQQSNQNGEAGRIGKETGTLEPTKQIIQKQKIKGNKPKPNMTSSRDSNLIQIPIKITMHSPSGPIPGPVKVTPTKRKPSALNIEAGPSKKQPDAKTRNLARKKEHADVSLNPAGYYEVQIDQELGETISKGCGIATKEVFDEVEADNMARQIEEELRQKDQLNQGDTAEPNWNDQAWDEYLRDYDQDEDLLDDEV